MAFSTCFSYTLFSPKIEHTRRASQLSCSVGLHQKSIVAVKGINSELFGQRTNSALLSAKLQTEWSFVGGSRSSIWTNHERSSHYRKSSRVYASWLATSQLASSAFTVGTLAILPFYTLMVLVPQAGLAKKIMESSLPHVVLGLLYAYLVYLSWTPNTIRYLFAGKSFLPELAGIMNMFSSEMTLASAWIHFLAVDLFAARHVYHDGLESKVPTQHSVSLCMMCCPIGILSHIITKAMINVARKRQTIGQIC